MNPAGPLINKLRLRLLMGRTWRYLRYLHLRECVVRISGDIKTVCVCGAGHGLAEVAIAAEFPHLRFTLTDIIAKGYPNYHAAMDAAWKNNINNVEFSIWDVMNETRRRFDLVCSTEMLEHIKDDERAAHSMRSASNKYVYCLVPFATDDQNANPAKRDAAWARHEHHVVGYSANRLRELFPQPISIAGTYWTSTGLKLRTILQSMSDDQIKSDAAPLFKLAEGDLLTAPPAKRAAQGIKILSRVS